MLKLRAHVLFVAAVVVLAGFATPASAKKPGPPVTEPFCGNRVIESDRGEACDGDNLGGKGCTTLGADFDGGVLTCGSTCQFDTTACTTCDNGVLETGEACDGEDLQGHTCESEKGWGFGELACNESCTGFDDGECRRFDADELTVSDSVTRLMWQRTTDGGELTDKDNLYSWTVDESDQFFEANGSVFTEFLATLNGLPTHTYQGCVSTDPTQSEPYCVPGPACFAGYCDWRLPESHELLSIVDPSRNLPAIDEELFGETRNDHYWTATMSIPECFNASGSSGSLWSVFFIDGTPFCSRPRTHGGGGSFPPELVPALHPARAVRYLGR